jgi:hypothetical protein
MYHAAAIGIHILSAVFLVGMLGSSVVVAISFFEDIHVLFSSDKEESPAPHPPAL